MAGVRQYIDKWLPIMSWTQGYSRGLFRDDLLGGMVVSFVTVPQAIAYAFLAGLPAEMGLYAAVAAMITYAVFGTNKALAVGPAAIIAMMTLESVSAMAEPGTADYINITLKLTLETGLILIILRVFNFGSLINFMSHAVVTGFISAAGILIIMNQVTGLLGIPGSDGTGFLQVSQHLYHLGDQFSTSSAVVSGISLALLIFIGFFLQKPLAWLGLPAGLISIFQKSAPMVVVLVSILVLRVFDMPADIAVVGEIPQRFPSFMGFAMSQAEFLQLFPSSFLIAMVVFVESSSIGTAVAGKRRERVQHNHELVGLGGANVASAFFGGFPVAGSFGRTMVNFSAGSATQAASLVTAVCVMLAIAFVGSAFKYLPECVLATIIIMAVRQLIDLKAIRRILTFSAGDAMTFLVTFIAVLFGGVETGILIGILVSFVLLIRSSSKPHIAIVGRVEGTERFRNCLRHEVVTYPKLLCMRVDESLYFVNSRYVENFLLKQIAQNSEIEQVLLIFSGVNFIDSSGLEMLETLNVNLHETGVTLHLAEVKGPVMDRLDRTEFSGSMHGQIFFTTDIAARELVAV